MPSASMPPRPLPDEAQRLCEKLHAPPRLVAHLILVHDAAAQITEALETAWPRFSFDKDAVLLGAATHDLGKVLFPEELSGPGSRHEEAGPELLRKQGWPKTQARFACTHAQWRGQRTPSVEDLLVALADTVWKGGRDEELETRLCERAALLLKIEPWRAYMVLDAIFRDVASKGGERLSWQAGFPS